MRPVQTDCSASWSSVLLHSSSGSTSFARRPGKNLFCFVDPTCPIQCEGLNSEALNYGWGVAVATFLSLAPETYYQNAYMLVARAVL